jgi:hypothetical protein
VLDDRCVCVIFLLLYALHTFGQELSMQSELFSIMPAVPRTASSNSRMRLKGSCPQIASVWPGRQYFCLILLPKNLQRPRILVAELRLYETCCQSSKRD